MTTPDAPNPDGLPHPSSLPKLPQSIFNTERTTNDGLRCCVLAASLCLIMCSAVLLACTYVSRVIG